MRLFTDKPKEEMTNAEVIAYLVQISDVLRELTLKVNLLEKKI